jgi:hypothetical protein
MTICTLIFMLAILVMNPFKFSEGWIAALWVGFVIDCIIIVVGSLD